MQKTAKYKNWIGEASSDLEFAEYALKGGFFSKCCFVTQQASEKTLKALAFYRGAKRIATHSIYKICKDLKINGEIEEASKILDQYYITARYPDAFPDGCPFEMFTQTQAKQAVELARMIFNKVTKELG